MKKFREAYKMVFNNQMYDDTSFIKKIIAVWRFATRLNWTEGGSE